MASEIVGRGVPVGQWQPFGGIAEVANDTDAVLALLKRDLSEIILIVSLASATGIAPALPEVRGIVCTSGGPTSHLALVAKEFGIPCVMAVSMQADIRSIEHRRVELYPDGTFAMVDEGEA